MHLLASVFWKIKSGLQSVLDRSCCIETDLDDENPRDADLPWTLNLNPLLHVLQAAAGEGKPGLLWLLNKHIFTGIETPVHRTVTLVHRKWYWWATKIFTKVFTLRFSASQNFTAKTVVRLKHWSYQSTRDLLWEVGISGVPWNPLVQTAMRTCGILCWPFCVWGLLPPMY